MEEVIAVDGAELWTETTGRGTVPLVLCHGGPGLSDNLGAVASMVDDLATVHRYDQRAGGRSSGLGPYTVERFTRDLEALRVRWGHDRWMVGGHSWGGWLALMYALAYPSRTSAVIAIGTPPPPDTGWREDYHLIQDSRLPEGQRRFFDEVRARRRAGEPIMDDEERAWIHLNWRTDFADPEAIPDFDREPLYGFPANYEVNRALAEEMNDGRHALLRELTSIRVPTLFIHGEGDPRPAPMDVVRSIDRARLVRIPGAGHLPWMERPDDVERAIRSFICAARRG